MTTRADVVAEALTWVDVPYKHAGRNRFGIDCAGVVIKVAHGTGLSMHDTTNYTQSPEPHEFLREVKGHLDRKHKRDLMPGDVIVFRGLRVPCHMGILDAEGNVIHAYKPAGKVLREAYVNRMERFAVSAWSYRGLAEA